MNERSRVPKVALERVTKAFGRSPPVLDGIDLAVAEGELVSLVGPSGCGKSTLLDLVAGFERPTSGAVRIDGAIVDDLPPGARGVAMVFQSYALYPHLTVRGNLAFPLDVAGLDRASIAARVAETAARLGLAELLDRLPKQLSGGQRQRVALGRALVRRPKICLFDEPLSNLDASLRGQMRAEIKKLHEELGATFVYVTHDQTEAMTMSDRVALLNGGKIQQIAPPREIYARPSNTFVAAFVGSPPINLLRGAAFAGRGGLITGVRPHDVEVGAGEPPPGAHAGRVYVVEPTGAETWVTVELAGERVSGRARADFSARSGDPAWARWEAGRRLFFDARTEARVEGP